MNPQVPAQETTSTQAPTQSQIGSTGRGPGGGTVNTIGIILISVYVVLLTLLSGYLLIKVWPHCIGTPSVPQATQEMPPPPNPAGQPGAGGGAAPGSPGNQSNQIPSASPSPTAATEIQCKNPEWIEFFWGRGYWLWEEIRLLVIVIIAGMLGALLHVIRSLFWYVGHRDLRASWILMYFLLPLAGALLAVAFYFVIRGGFFPQAKADQSNPVGFAALALLIGLFSGQAGQKLKQIFETVFSPAPQGANARPQVPGAPPATAPPTAPKVSTVSPAKGPTSGGQLVVIAGADFKDGATVSFAGEAANSVTFIDSATINAVTPAHAAGSVDVVVTNKDSQSAPLPNGYTYEA